MDYQASHGLEDFVAVIEGRESVVHEIEQSDEAPLDYLAQAAQALLEKSQFLDVLSGFALDQERVPFDTFCDRASYHQTPALVILFTPLRSWESKVLAQSWHIPGTNLAQRNYRFCKPLITKMFKAGAGRGGRTSAAAANT
jgi:hypothetical protein